MIAHLKINNTSNTLKLFLDYVIIKSKVNCQLYNLKNLPKTYTLKLGE